MNQTVRIDRDAFRRGVEDVMTLAPLREAIRNASGVFIKPHEKDTVRACKDVSPGNRDTVKRDGKSSYR